jgi:hypothetical protein
VNREQLISSRTATKPFWKKQWRAARIALRVIEASQSAVKMHPRMMQTYEECGWNMQYIPINQAEVQQFSLHDVPQIKIHGRSISLDNSLPVGSILAA